MNTREKYNKDREIYLEAVKLLYILQKEQSEDIQAFKYKMNKADLTILCVDKAIDTKRKELDILFEKAEIEDLPKSV